MIDNNLRSIITVSGMGGWSINIEAVKLLIGNQVDDVKRVLTRIERVLDIYLRIEDG